MKLSQDGAGTMVLGTALLTSVLVAAGASGNPFSDFDDGTLQGWTPLEPFGGDLTAEPTGGHPDGFLLVTDTVAGGGALIVQGPEEFRGDLSVYDGLAWDEFVYDHGAENEFASRPILIGPNNTKFMHDRLLDVIGAWDSLYVVFQEEYWTRLSGERTFDDVLADCTLAINCSGSLELGREIGLDNITLVPEPAIALIVLLGGMTALRRR